MAESGPDATPPAPGGMRAGGVWLGGPALQRPRLYRVSDQWERPRPPFHSRRAHSTC